MRSITYTPTRTESKKLEVGGTDKENKKQRAEKTKKNDEERQ